MTHKFDTANAPEDARDIGDGCLYSFTDQGSSCIWFGEYASVITFEDYTVWSGGDAWLERATVTLHLAGVEVKSVSFDLERHEVGPRAKDILLAWAQEQTEENNE